MTGARTPRDDLPADRPVVGLAGRTVAAGRGVVGVEDERVDAPLERARLRQRFGAGDVHGADDLQVRQRGADERDLLGRKRAVQLQRR